MARFHPPSPQLSSYVGIQTKQQAKQSGHFAIALKLLATFQLCSFWHSQNYKVKIVHTTLTGCGISKSYYVGYLSLSLGNSSCSGTNQYHRLIFIGQWHFHIYCIFDSMGRGLPFHIAVHFDRVSYSSLFSPRTSQIKYKHDSSRSGSGVFDPEVDC